MGFFPFFVCLLHSDNWMPLEAEQLCNVFIPSMLAQAAVTELSCGMAVCCSPLLPWLHKPSPVFALGS